MATIRLNSSVVTISAGSKFFVCDRENGSISRSVKKAIDVTEISNNLPVVRSVREDEDSKKMQIQKKMEILCSAFSSDGTLFCVLTSAKTCLIYKSEDFALMRAFRIPKTPTAVVFDKEGRYVIVSDRAGNVTRYNCAERTEFGEMQKLDINGEETNHEGEPLTGAISMILDVTISDCGKFLISGDRDEKIRVSRYPQSYVVQSYALGHSAYVGTLSVVGSSVFSSGGDATVKQFRFEDGKLLNSSKKLSEEQPVRRIRALTLNRQQLIVASTEKSNILVLLSENVLSEVKKVSLPAPAIDFIMDDGKAFVITNVGVCVVDFSTFEQSTIDIDDCELKESVSNAKDPLPSYFKTVSRQNMVDYHERKSKKLKKVAEEKERKAAKRKADKESDIKETKKVEVSVT